MSDWNEFKTSYLPVAEVISTDMQYPLARPGDLILLVDSTPNFEYSISGRVKRVSANNSGRHTALGGSATGHEYELVTQRTVDGSLIVLTKSGQLRYSSYTKLYFLERAEPDAT